MKPLSHNCGCEIVGCDRDIVLCPLHSCAGEMRAMLRQLVLLDDDDTDNLEGLKASARELLSAIAGGNQRV